MYKPLITSASKRYGNNRWESFSIKLKRNVYLFSDLEYQHWLQIETDPNIIDFCEQAIKMEIIEDNKKQFSIIDMWVRYKNGKQFFIEIKYSKDLMKDSVKKQINVQQLWCKANQATHLIKTEYEIGLSPIKLSNLKLLIRQVKNTTEIKQEKIDIVKKHISGQPKLIQQIAIETNIEISELIKIVCILVNNGYINCDLDATHLGKNMEVWKICEDS
ncbi:TnsA endonuclease N-terminal domain-containing protein [Lysinibacillus cavernae]|uniref:TnsA endonuclease N-terminal domain-containing protein n=1 Tax=Lysinibacillus cavernae TaxID=2666135 RepID=UPI0012D93ED8|nr:TnsA endonuclease N-terminal domain-containing protein [Lysinibacillus cavernae]